MVNNIENGVNISTVKSKDELPNSIIVTQVPEEVFTNPEYKQNFCQLFTQIEEDIHFDFLKSFRRVRVIFSTPESATAAKLIVQGFSFHGYELKAFLAQEMPPVICNFDLMARLASFALDDKYEVHNGDKDTPAIIVHPCETPLDAPSSIEMPRTPRPSSPAY
ncbi:Calcipressin [Ancylostoma ceylanicum]|uniref:Calcipressin n=1 Tax=Ancylostoma ceylanicum TaxID=53326 RepID=A0A0D6LR44_9BILA|nr:Calcipressin [Ancylostoma ceylanicum]